MKFEHLFQILSSETYANTQPNQMINILVNTETFGDLEDIFIIKFECTVVKI